MVLSGQEVLDILIMSVFLGWLFEDLLRPKTLLSVDDDDIVNQYLGSKKSKWYNSNFFFSVLVVAPAVILHELGHKFVAMSFGLEATFFAFYHEPLTLGLAALAAFLKISGFGFVFIVPGFVGISAGASSMESFWIAFAGPLVHLIFFVGSVLVEKFATNLSARVKEYVYLSKWINGLLFLINMLPIPGIDGWAVYTNFNSWLF